MKQKRKVLKKKSASKKQSQFSNRLLWGIVILFVALFIIVIFSGQRQIFEGNAQTAITPTFGSIGDCQTNGTCPTGTTSTVPSNTAITGIPGNNNPSPTTIQPCNAQNSQISAMAANRKVFNNKVKANKNGGFFQLLLQFFMQLLQLLQQLLGGGTGTTPPPVGNQPTLAVPSGGQPSSAPSQGEQPTTGPNPSQAPCPPTTAPQPTTGTSQPTVAPTSTTSGPTATIAPAPTSGGGTTSSCVTSDFKGRCPTSGYYTDPQIVGGTNPWVNQNVWGAGGTNYQQTLHANSAGDWYITASVSNSKGSVLTFPNTGWTMPTKTIDSYATITSSWNVTIPTDSTTTAGWAAYDLWFNNWADEVMIQTDIVANSNYNCSSVASTTINGQPWHLCDFGSERVVKPGTDDNHLRNEPSGSVDVKAVLQWLEQTGHLPAKSVWTGPSFGFEVTNTSGTTQTFKVNGFTWTSQ